MKKTNYARIIILVLSIALLIGSVMCIPVMAEESSTQGEFGGISVSYEDKVFIRVKVNATKEEIENGTVVVTYTMNETTKKATYYQAKDGSEWVITEGIAAYELAEEVVFNSYVGDVQVESNRKYSVAQFLYTMLYTNSELAPEFKTLYESLLAYGEASEIALKKKTENFVTDSSIAYTNNADISLNGKSVVFAPAESIEALTPVWNGAIPVGKELEGWLIKTEGSEESVKVGLSFDCTGAVEILQPVFADVDATAFTLANGGFENGLEGWKVVGNIGSVSSATHYWVNDPESAEGFAFGMDGTQMFSAYTEGASEGAVGTLTSSTFTVGGSGFVTFKLGAMKDGNSVYVDVVDAETKEILARYYNGLWADRTNGIKSGCTLVAYKADLSAFMGREVFFRISDNAYNDYGLFFVDSFNTYYTSEPQGFNDATPVNYTVSGTIYDVFNGGFEFGDNRGWWNVGEIGVVTNATGYWDDNIPYNKDGEFLFTGVHSFGADTMREGNRGYLISSVFEIGGTGIISFKLGGGGNELCYVQVIDATTGEILARYHQQQMEDGVLKQYVADLSAYIGRTVRIQVVDQAESGWGCVSFDNVVTYYPEGAALPENAIIANDIKGDLKYTIDNGSFESGKLDGWNMNITEEGTHNTLGWVQSSEVDSQWYTKNDANTMDGEYLFSFWSYDDKNAENSKGTLQSSTFSLKQGAIVAFRFGGAGGGINHDVFIELCRADGSVIARFYNDAEGKDNTRMNAYFYKYGGPEVNCFFRVVDNSTSNYGCFVVDDFRVNLVDAPEGFIAAIQ